MNDELYHHGIKGQKWGVRRYQNKDGSLTKAGRKRYGQELQTKVQNSLNKDGYNVHAVGKDLKSTLAKDSRVKSYVEKNYKRYNKASDKWSDAFDEYDKYFDMYDGYDDREMRKAEKKYKKADKEFGEMKKQGIKFARELLDKYKNSTVSVRPNSFQTDHKKTEIFVNQALSQLMSDRAMEDWKRENAK